MSQLFDPDKETSAPEPARSDSFSQTESSQPAQPPKKDYPQAKEHRGIWDTSSVYGDYQPKKEYHRPWWATLLASLSVLIGTAFSTNSFTHTDSKPGYVSSYDAVSKPGPTLTYATPTVYPLFATPKPSVAPKEIGVRVEGAGQELVDQKVDKKGLYINVNKVDRFSQINDNDGKGIQAKGVFLVITYFVANRTVDRQILDHIFLTLTDGQGKTYSSSTLNKNFLELSSQYSKFDDIPLYGVGSGYELFEVPTEANDFKFDFDLKN